MNIGNHCTDKDVKDYVIEMQRIAKSKGFGKNFNAIAISQAFCAQYILKYGSDTDCPIYIAKKYDFQIEQTNIVLECMVDYYTKLYRADQVSNNKNG